MTKTRNKVIEVNVCVSEAEVFTTDNESFRFVQTGICPLRYGCSNHLAFMPDEVIAKKLDNKIVRFIDGNNKTFFFNRDRIRRITTTPYDTHWIRMTLRHSDTIEFTETTARERVRLISEDPPTKKSGYDFWFYAGCAVLAFVAIYWAVKFLTPLS